MGGNINIIILTGFIVFMGFLPQALAKTIILRDGTIIEGEVLEETQDQVRFQNAVTRVETVYPMEDIKKIDERNLLSEMKGNLEKTKQEIQESLEAAKDSARRAHESLAPEREEVQELLQMMEEVERQERGAADQ